MGEALPDGGALRGEDRRRVRGYGRGESLYIGAPARYREKIRRAASGTCFRRIHLHAIVGVRLGGKGLPDALLP